MTRLRGRMVEDMNSAGRELKADGGADVLRWLNVMMTAVFALCVAVQYNDPDAVLWMLIYAYAVVVTAMAAADRYTFLAVLGFVGFFAGFAFLSPGFLEISDPRDVVTDIRMDSEGVEVAREAGGLLISSLWLLVLSVVWYRRRGDRASPKVDEE